MDCDDRLYVEIVPMERGTIPHPHPITEGRFDPSLVYKVLGMYNPSETSECYLMLANSDRELWFIPQRHTRAYALLESKEFFLPKDPCLASRPHGEALLSKTNAPALRMATPAGKSHR